MLRRSLSSWLIDEVGTTETLVRINVYDIPPRKCINRHAFSLSSRRTYVSVNQFCLECLSGFITWLCFHCAGLFEMIVGFLTTPTSFSRCNPIWCLSMGLRQGSGLCSSSSHKYPGTERTNQNRHWNHHRWHATNSLERTRLSCWCL